MAKIKSVYIITGSIILSIIFFPGFIRFMELRAKNSHLEREIKRLENENMKLYNEKKRLQNDIEYVEKVARESMGVTRKGEMPIRIEK